MSGQLIGTVSVRRGQLVDHVFLEKGYIVVERMRRSADPRNDDFELASRLRIPLELWPVYVELVSRAIDEATVRSLVPRR